MHGAHDHAAVTDNPLAHIIGVAILEFGVLLHRFFSFFSLHGGSSHFLHAQHFNRPHFGRR